jgi:hypothetical protein
MDLDVLLQGSQNHIVDVKHSLEDMVFVTSVPRVVLEDSPVVLITVLTLFVVTLTQILKEDTSKVVDTTLVAFHKTAVFVVTMH